jgi:hypothetical protein
MAASTDQPFLQMRDSKASLQFVNMMGKEYIIQNTGKKQP